ncbi:hypothetical protein K0M31_016127 [Melipona bicolor]|uniref:Uncharacterized protein n=1 Tax=Melipona bicolor TaxID=60889 RepID=A0AA40KTA4_9HYME|nr:hypothetical protein K0M31_016127 [Melipona bicolor]
MQSPPIESYRGWWTIPYFSCKSHRWLISYSINIRPPDARHGLKKLHLKGKVQKIEGILSLKSYSYFEKRQDKKDSN